MDDGTWVRGWGLRTALLCGATLALTACDAEEPDRGARILAGTSAHGGAYAAVFNVHNEAVGGRCTGTLIGPYAILTAAHCVTIVEDGVLYKWSPEAFTVDNGPYEPSNTEGIGAVEVAVHPQYDPQSQRNDLAVLRLADDGMGLSDGHLLRPTRELTEDIVGLAGGIDLVGYGINDLPQVEVGPNRPPVGQRLHVTHEVESLGCAPNLASCSAADDYINWDNGTAAGTCSGDSGGPVLVFRDDQGQLRPRPVTAPYSLHPPDGGSVQIGGVISWGEADDCLSGQDHGARVDTALSFLDPFVADLNGDGTVSYPDFLVFSGSYGTNDSEADLDGDGKVGFSDFRILSSVFSR